MLLDGDNRVLADHDVIADGLVVGRWARYEAENYLIHSKTLQRYAESKAGPLFAAEGAKYLKDELPGAVLRDPLGDHDYLNRTPASKTLLPGFFKSIDVTLTKKDYYLIAEQMKPEEIAQEVKQKLDDIARTLGIIS